MPKQNLPTHFLLGFVLYFSVAGAQPGIPNTKEALSKLYFINNQGQLNVPRTQVHYYARMGTASFYFQPDGITASLCEPIPVLNKIDTIQAPIKRRGHAVKISFQDASPDIKPFPNELQTYKCNYFLGNDPAKWHTDIPTYGGLTYKNVWPGIDLRYFGNDKGQLEYDVIVAPYADPGFARFRYEGMDDIYIDEQGNLVVQTSIGRLIEHQPIVYQIISGEKKNIPTEFFIARKSSFPGYISAEVSFRPGKYDPAYALVIDPVYSTFIGGSGAEFPYDLTVDNTGNAYLTGNTSSNDFPVVPGAYDMALNGSSRVFVTKLNPSGTALIFSTYLGGTDPAKRDIGFGIAIDNLGNSYITGTTNSPDFPVLSGGAPGTLPYQSLYRGLNSATNGFITKLNPTGNALIYSTYLGGSGSSYGLGYQADHALAIKVDIAGRAYVAGLANSLDFPLVSAYQTVKGAPYFDLFLALLDPTGTTLLYSTLLGGNGNEWDCDLALDNDGNAYLTTMTQCTDFPVFPNPGAFQTSRNGFSDAIVAKIDPDIGGAGSLLYSTYIGSSAPSASIMDAGIGIDVDDNNDVYICGMAGNNTFPTTPGAYNNIAGGGFFAKLRCVGNGADDLLYATLTPAKVTDIAVGDDDHVFVTGWITAGVSFVATPDAFQPAVPGSTNNFLMKFSPRGKGPADLKYLSYLGGADAEGTTSVGHTDKFTLIDVDSSGYVYVSSTTESADFPVTAGAYDGSKNPSYDVYVTKFYLTPVIDTPDSLDFGKVACGDQPEKTINISNLSPDVNLRVANATITGPDAADFKLVFPAAFPDTINKNSAKNYRVQFDPISASGTKTAYLNLFNDDGYPLSDTLQVIVLTASLDSLVIDAGPGKSICSGDSVALAATGANTYSWSPSTGLNSTIGSPVKASPSATTRYYINGTDGVCTGIDSIDVVVKAVPVSEFTLDGQGCAEEDLTVVFTGIAPPGTSFTWDFAGGSAAPGTGAGPHTVTWYSPGNKAVSLQLSNNGCTSGMTTHNIQVGQDNASFQYISGTFCKTGSDPVPTITGLPGGTFSSSPSGLAIDPATGKINLAGSPTGSYSITYTTNGPCPHSKSVVVTITQAQDATFQYNGSYCENSDAKVLPVFPAGSSAGTFTASGAGLVFISNTTGEVNLQNSLPGTYTVTNTLVASGGCAKDEKTAIITIFPKPTADFISDNPSCPDIPAIISYTGNASGNATYNWSFDGGAVNSGTGQGPYTVSWPSSGQKELTLQVEENACKSEKKKTILALYPKPSASIELQEDSIRLCENSSFNLPLLLTGTGPWMIEYSEAGTTRSFISDTPGCSIALVTAGWFRLIRVSDAHCDSLLSDSLYIDFIPLPVLDAFFPARVCPGDSAGITLQLTGSLSPFDVQIDGATILSDVENGYVHKLKVNRDTAITFTSIGYSDQPICTNNPNRVVKIDTLQSPVIFNLQFTCNSTSDQYRVSFSISGGDSNSYTVNGMPSASSFQSGWIAANSAYAFTVDDVNSCDPKTLSGSHSCNCTTDAGSYVSTGPADVCENMPAVYLHAGDQVLDGNDILEFLLHDGDTDSIGNILLRNTSGTFVFGPPLNFNTTYYITPVAGNNEGGKADPGDPCLSEGTGIPVTFRQLPDLKLTVMPNDSLCIGDEAVLHFAFTGAGPFSVVSSNGSLSGINSGDSLVLADLASTTNFSCTGVSGSYCSRDINEQVTIHVAEAYVFSPSYTPISCTGETDGAIDVAVTGGFGRYAYTWRNSAGNPVSSSSIATGLGKGGYSLEVSDYIGCSHTENYTLSEPPLYGFSFLDIFNETCFQQQDGELRVGAPDGRFYKFSNTGTNETIDSIPMDSFLVSLSFIPGTNMLIIEVESLNGCKADSMINMEGLYPITLITSESQLICPGTSTQIGAAASGGNGSFTYFWNGLQGGPVKNVSPGVTTTYEVYAEDQKGCPSAKVNVTISLPEKMSQSVAGDVQYCFGEEISLTAIAGGGTGGYQYRWTDSQGNEISTDQNYSGNAGASETYQVTTTDSCKTAINTPVRVEVAPQVNVDFTVLPDTAGCAPLALNFVNQSTGPGHTAEWLINNKVISNAPKQCAYLFSEPGNYSLALAIEDTVFGCRYLLEKKRLIDVFEQARSAFTYQPEEVTLLSPVITLNNRSTAASAFRWTLDGTQISTLPQPSVVFPADAEREYQLCLEAVNAAGCNDEICKRIVVSDVVTLYVPNSFSPNNDGINDTFQAEGAGIDTEGFLLQVFDRWGEVIFETKDINEGWNGTYGGEPVKSDVFSWKIVLRAKGKAEKIERAGKILLQR